MLFLAATLFLLSITSASPVGLLDRRSCPSIHVFGARETTASPGFGTAGVVVNLILAAYPGSTSEAISYPACGGQSSCGGISYANSALQGISAVAAAVNSFNSKCPSTQLVLVGYSQGGQIMDDAFCGGGDTNEGLYNSAIPIQGSAVSMIKAAIFMGDPRYISGLSYEVGTCRAAGFAPRPAGFQCPSAAKIRSYCDAADPYCCNGNNAATHQGYGNEYGQAALAFAKSKLSASTGTSTGSSGGSSTTISVNESCGNGVTCQGSAFGNCCSKWGYCGSTGIYCDVSQGCQSAWGSCLNQ